MVVKPKLILLITLAACSLYAAFVFLPEKNKKLWSSGRISNQHQMIADNCEACHVTPYLPVEDSACRNCHKLNPHAEDLIEPNCTTCHLEHHGESVTISDSRLCFECHDDISEAAFDDHPEFELPDEDSTNIKLNHKIHIQDEEMQCKECHQISSETGQVAAISFEAHCKSCHSLGFDERLEELEVPHAEPDLVFNFMYAEYAKLFLEDEQANQAFDIHSDIRRRPGYQAKAQKEKNEFTKQAVLSETRQAESELFERTACHLCHEIQSKKIISPETSRYTVLKPEIPERWLNKSIFNHIAHTEITCESCHQGVSDSTETSDLLLPNVKNCQNCHATDTHGKIKSDCIMCHSYHDSLDLEHKRRIQEIVEALS